MKNLLKIAFLLFIGTMYAQQESIFTLYKYNMNVINPAYAGTDGVGNITFLNRSQWSGVEDAPEIQTLMASIPLGEKVGLGVSGVREQVFIESFTSFYVDFSYKLQVSDNANLFLGLKAGGGILDVDVTRLGVSDPLLVDNIDDFNPNIGIGAYLKGDRYFLSLSAPRLLSTERVREREGVATTAKDKVHIYLSGGYNFPIGDKVDFNPSLLAAYVDGADTSITLTGAFEFFERFELGGAYRFDEAWAGLASITFDWFKFGYAYEGSTDSNFRSLSGSDGTHEIFVSIRF